MSTTRVTRSAAKHTAPAARSSGSAAVASQSSKAVTGVRKAASAKPTKAKKHAAPSESPVTPPRKRARHETDSPSREGPLHHDTFKLNSLAGQNALEVRDHESNLPPVRPAEPHQTNAMLQTPRGTQVITYSEQVLHSSPSRTGIPKPTTTTDRLLEDGIAHLIKVEPKLKDVIAQHHCHIFSPEGLAESIDPFRSLASGIMAQQVSGAAAAAIKKRFVALFIPETQGQSSETYLRGKGDFPTPEQVAQADITFMRTAGLSQRKAEYVKGLAEKFVSGELSAQLLVNASYDEVLEKLTAVRGLGKWSVEMFACFGLKRMDVFSTGDLGVQRGMAALKGRDVRKLKNKGGKWKYMGEQEMLELAEKFAPYKSLFMWYMWRIEEPVNLEAIEQA